MIQLSVATSSSAPRAHGRFGLLATALGVAAAVISFVLTWRHSIGNDEGATLTSALRGWGALWEEVVHLDAVHAGYYALMHLWFDVVPANPSTLRLPSAVFVGAAVVLLAFIGRRLFTPATGLAAAAVLAVMPRVTYVGSDARSLALALALSLAATLVLLRAGEGRGARRWVLYAALVFLAAFVNFYTLLVVPAHLLMLGTRGARVRALASAGSGALLASPVILLAAGQSGQLGWLETTGWHSVREVLVEQFADTSTLAALGLWIGAIAGLMVLIRRERRLVPAMLWWLLGPTGLLLLISLVQPLYHPRYVTASAPALALLVGLALVALPRRWMFWVGLVLIASLCIPAWAARRTAVGLDGSRWDVVAAAVRQEREPAVADVVVYGPMPKKTHRSHRRVALSYPDAFAGAVDLTLGAPSEQNEYLWGADDAPLSHLDRLDGRDRVLILVAQSERAGWAGPLEAELQRRGFALEAQREVRGSDIVVYRR